MSVPPNRFSSVALLLLGAACGAATDGPTCVVLITLDTTRADRLGCYGYGRDTSPNLDALAAEGVVYARARSTSSWTLPGHAALFTGRFARSHGARYDPEGALRLNDVLAAEGETDRFRVWPLVESELTLAEVLAERGYATGAVVAGPWMKRVFGLAQGFESYDERNIDSLVGRLAQDVTDAALAWLDEAVAGEERPFFLFLNYYDPHGPYGAPPPYKFRFVEGAPEPVDGRYYPAEFLAEAGSRQGEALERMLSDLYDGEILYVDHHLGRLVEGLRERGLFERTLFVVTADHGEVLGEHGFHGHGEDLYEQELAIPLVVRPRGGSPAPRVSDAPAQLVDVVPLVLGELGIPVPPNVQGEAPGREDRTMVAELYTLPEHRRAGATWRAAYAGGRKLWWSSAGERALFDLAADPDERSDLAAREPARAAELATWLERWADSLPDPDRSAVELELDEETSRALSGLGYAQ